MRIISSYEHMEPTYAAVRNGLESLGFIEKSTDERLVFINKKYDSVILLPPKKPHEIMHRARFAAVCLELENFGVVEHMDDFGKMIKAQEISRQVPAQDSARKAQSSKVVASPA